MLVDGSSNQNALRTTCSPTGWVEVWLDRLDLPEIEVAALIEFLTPAELALCDRCRLPHVRQHKIVARARLRQILSGYLGRSPQEIEISTGLQGKPQVAGIEFNLSHSGDLVIYAVSDRPVGIDIERVRSMDLSGIVQRFFAASEFAAWQKLPIAEQEAAFFRVWTIKEAYLKAIGTGLHTPLSEVEVSMDTNHPKIIQAPNHQNWQLQPIPNHATSNVGANLSKTNVQQQNFQIKLRQPQPQSSDKQSPVETSKLIGLPPGYVGALIITAGVNSIEFRSARWSVACG
jgi:4'-phosphopantetheinyl transferase